jgi:hypothetical protein
LQSYRMASSGWSMRTWSSSVYCSRSGMSRSIRQRN